MSFYARIPWSSVISVSMSSIARRKTYYDVLQINPKSTQSEIKAAYFKLTMQYHPDKNSSEDAKIKFREISEAYEVLGTYDRRRQYDRGLQIRTPVHDKHQTTGVTGIDIEKEAERVHRTQYRQTQSDGRPIFNFDVWTEAHYGRIFARSQKEKRKHQFFMNARKEANQSSNKIIDEATALILFSFIIFGFMTLRFQFWDKFDTPQSIAEKRQNSGNDNIPHRESNTHSP